MGLKPGRSIVFLEKERFVIFFLLPDLGRIRELPWSLDPNKSGAPRAAFSLRRPQDQTPLEGIKQEKKTDESTKEGDDSPHPSPPVISITHPPRGKFNKVHIPRATKERDENT